MTALLLAGRALFFPLALLHLPLHPVCATLSTCFPQLHQPPCSACRAVWYCGTTCSHADWRAGHRRVCKPLGVVRAAEKERRRQTAAATAAQAAEQAEQAAE